MDGESGESTEKYEATSVERKDLDMERLARSCGVDCKMNSAGPSKMHEWKTRD